MVGVSTDSQPRTCQNECGASFFIAPIAFALVLLPMTDSAKNIGRDIRKAQKIYVNIKRAPPYSPTM